MAFVFDFEIPVEMPAAAWAQIRRDWCDDPEHNLRRRWLREHPDLFRESDWMRKQPSLFLPEWYAAVWLKQHRGLLSLANKYSYHGSRDPKHAWKADVLRKCLTPEQFAYIRTKATLLFEPGQVAGWPDLFVYAPDHKSCRFCEVKGPGDKLRPEQEHVFGALRAKTGLEVGLLTIGG